MRIVRSELAPLAIQRAQDAKVSVIVGKNERSITLNLKAPLVLNLDSRLGHRWWPTTNTRCNTNCRAKRRYSRKPLNGSGQADEPPGVPGTRIAYLPENVREQPTNDQPAPPPPQDLGRLPRMERGKTDPETQSFRDHESR